MNAFERAQRAMKRRGRFETWAAIAQAEGYASPGAARNAVMREMMRQSDRDRAELRSELLNALVVMAEAAAPYAVGMPDAADPKERKPSMFAQDRVHEAIRQIRQMFAVDQQPDQAAATLAPIIREYQQGIVEAV